MGKLKYNIKLNYNNFFVYYDDIICCMKIAIPFNYAKDF